MKQRSSVSEKKNKGTPALPVIKMILEGEDGSLTGRVTYDDNLIVDDAQSVSALEESMKKLLFDFHGLEPGTYEFQFEYDLTAFFEEFSFLNITKVAEYSGLNGSLVRQYATGKKFPSAKQVEKIESAVKELAQKILNINIYVRS